MFQMVRISTSHARAQPTHFTLDRIWAGRQDVVRQHTENFEML